jgi:hypothetical protein
MHQDELELAPLDQQEGSPGFSRFADHLAEVGRRGDGLSVYAADEVARLDPGLVADPGTTRET